MVYIYRIFDRSFRRNQIHKPQAFFFFGSVSNPKGSQLKKSHPNLKTLSMRTHNVLIKYPYMLSAKIGSLKNAKNTEN